MMSKFIAKEIDTGKKEDVLKVLEFKNEYYVELDLSSNIFDNVRDFMNEVNMEIYVNVDSYTFNIFFNNIYVESFINAKQAIEWIENIEEHKYMLLSKNKDYNCGIFSEMYLKTQLSGNYFYLDLSKKYF